MLKRYYSDDHGETMLELHNNRTLWKINNENLTDDDYNYLVSCAIDKFKILTNTELFLCGRSGRHVCIQDNKRNQLNYWNYKKIAEELEKELIITCNK